MTGFEANPAALKASAPVYLAHSQTLTDIYDTLVGKLNDAGDCWGNDDAGKAFAAKYVGPAVKALDQIAEACTGLGTAGQGTYTWAINYLNAQDTDQQDVTNLVT
ncbi:MAG TPA: hypothetical protein VFI65_17435 [Streptosporangiaceae bacterium]|nr:hypothetical protein [Streptosporangiaceae bacterium]